MANFEKVKLTQIANLETNAAKWLSFTFPKLEGCDLSLEKNDLGHYTAFFGNISYVIKTDDERDVIIVSSEETRDETEDAERFGIPSTSFINYCVEENNTYSLVRGTVDNKATTLLCAVKSGSESKSVETHSNNMEDDYGPLEDPKGFTSTDPEKRYYFIVSDIDSSALNSPIEVDPSETTGKLKVITLKPSPSYKN